MPQLLVGQIAILKNSWDVALYKRSSAPEAKSEPLSIKAPILIDPNSTVNFQLRAPTAAHFGMTGIEIPTGAKPYKPPASGTPKVPTNKNLLENRKAPGFRLDNRTNIAKLCKLKLPTAITKNLTNRTGTTTGSYTGEKPTSRIIKWSIQRFPPICSSDWILAFLAENCATLPKEVIISKKRFFMNSETPKPAGLTPNQIEGDDAPFPTERLWAAFGP